VAGGIGFTQAEQGGAAAEVPTIGIGMLGYAFMGKAHSNAFRTIPYMTWPPPLMPRLVAIAGRSAEQVTEAAGRYGFERATTDWRDVVSDDAVGLFDNCGPNSVHAEASVAAAENGKHVLCEKPLGRTADESFETWRRVDAAAVKHMCAFNYRFVPAVRLAREMIDAGELGELRHFRGRYLQEFITDPEFPMIWRLEREVAGSGALGDLGAHVFDLARYLVGEVASISATTRTFIPERPGGTVTVDDAFESVVEFESGAVGTVEASRFCPGRKNAFTWEVNGAKGSIAFDLERLNELQVGTADQGFRTVLVSEPDHPFWEWWWPPGHMIGWEHTFVHEIHHLLRAIAEDTDVGPHGATFEDGYRAAEICDAVLRSDESGRREPVDYREL
jgi:predicted dehydrogenase